MKTIQQSFLETKKAFNSLFIEIIKSLKIDILLEKINKITKNIV